MLQPNNYGWQNKDLSGFHKSDMKWELVELIDKIATSLDRYLPIWYHLSKKEGE